LASQGTLTINGNFNNLETATGRTVDIRGSGNTNWNGILSSAGAATGLGFNTSGSVTIGGSTPSTATHSSSTFTQGRVIINRSGNLNPLGSNSLIAFGGGSLESLVNLTGANAFTNALRLDNNFGVIAGSQSIEFAGNATNGSFRITGGDRRITNNLTGGAVLSFSTNTFQLSDDAATGRTFTLSGSGATAISVPILNTSGTSAQASVFTYTPSSSASTLSITGASTNVLASGWTGAANFNGGTTTLSGAGTFGAGGLGLITVSNGAVLTLDNAATNTASRLGNRAVTLNGATYNFIGNSAGTTESTAPGSALTLGSGQSSINVTQTSGGSTIMNFSALTAKPVPPSTSPPMPPSAPPPTASFSTQLRRPSRPLRLASLHVASSTVATSPRIIPTD
jgi:hypothetical protein